MKIVIVGAGAAGLAAAWLLAKRHDVILVEKNDRLGGHAHTAHLSDGRPPVDTGFIVYNEPNYPNLTEWFRQLSVATQPSDMSFAVSRDRGRFEYAGGSISGLLAQPGLALRPRFWSMIRDLLRFYREAPQQVPDDQSMSLGDFLRRGNYSRAFVQDHLLPFAAAVWSTPAGRMLDCPAAGFLRFCENHGLLKIRNRPEWRTVCGGSATYVKRVSQAIGESRVRTDYRVERIERSPRGLMLTGHGGQRLKADHVVIATHADQALALLEKPDALEARLLGSFSYESNLAILHTDRRFMPRRRRAWSSWNYVEHTGDDPDRVSVSYWMNRLQSLSTDEQYFVTLNPAVPPAADAILRSSIYDHPRYTVQSSQAQRQLWQLQGHRGCWYCGSYFGAGFHEDAVQAGFAVAEQLGGLERPWQLPEPSNRIVVSETRPAGQAAA